MESITLQTNDAIISSGDSIGQLQFAASNESDGSASRYVIGKIYAQGEGVFNTSSNPASLVFATSASDNLPASGKIKISHEGHILPLEDNVYDLGSSSERFRHLYVADTVVSPTGELSYLYFDTTVGDVDQVAGQLNWNSEAGSLDLGLTDDLTIHLGQSVLFRVKNSTGSTITKGEAVYASGVLGGGQIIQVAPFVADESIDEVRFIGLMTDDLANGEDGFVNHFGHIKNVDLRTSNTVLNPNAETWAAGDILFVDDSSAGGLTKVQPKNDIYVALVLADGQNGELFVRITDPGHINDLHDVDTSGLVDNNFLVWNSGNEVWEPSTTLTFDGTTLHTDTDGISAIFGRNNSLTNGGKVRIFVDDNDTASSVQAIKAFNNKTTGTNYGINATANGLGATKNVGLYGWAAQATTNWGLWVDAGYSIFDERVGIGTTSPDALLHVNNGVIRVENASDPTIEFDDSSAVRSKVYYDTSSETFVLQHTDADANQLVLTSGNDVGIGTASPNATLHVYSATSGDNIFNVEGTNGSLFSVVDNLSGVLMSVNNNAGLPVFEVYDDDSIIGGRFAQNDFIVTTSGDVGVGTANPVSKLEVNGTITANGGDSDEWNQAYDWVSASGGLPFASGTGSAGHVAFWTDTNQLSYDSSQLRWDSSNNRLTIGNGTAIYPLNVVGSAGITSTLNAGEFAFYGDNLNRITKTTSLITHSTSTYNRDFSFGSFTGATYTTSFYINNGTRSSRVYNNLFVDGKIGVKNLSPVYDLDVDGSGNFTQNLSVGGDVGIGTDSPVSKLDVSGVITATGGDSDEWNQAYDWVSASGGLPFASGTGAATRIAYWDDASTLTSSSRLTYTSNSRLILDTNGTGGGIYIKSYGTDIGSITVPASTYLSWNTVSNKGHGFVVGSSLKMLIDTNGRVGINNPSPAYTLDVAGTANITGDVIVGGNVTVNGTTVSANVDTMEVADPILTLGLSSGNIVTNTNLDRGMALALNDGVMGFMGWDTSENEFSLLSSGVASNGSGNYAPGTYGDLHVGNLEATDGYFSGNVGIGTASPSYKLDVNGDIAATGLYLYDNGQSAYKNIYANNNDVYFPVMHGVFGYGVGVRNNRGTNVGMDSNGANGYLAIAAGGGEKIRIDTAGNVGIGTTSPTEKLHVMGGTRIQGDSTNTTWSSASPTLSIKRANDHPYISYHNNAGTRIGYLQFSSSQDASLNVDSNYGLRLRTNNADSAYISNDGKMGIGTMSPTTLLDVSGVITATGGNSTEWNEAYDWIQASGLDGTGSASGVAFWTDSNTLSNDSALIWDSTNDRLGIGTASPSGTLHVVGDAYVDNLKLDGNTLSTTNTNGDLIISPDGDGAIQRDSGGNARGAYAVDFQTCRNAPTQVATGVNSVIAGGRANTVCSTGGCSSIVGGYNNTVNNIYSFIGGGTSNNASGTYSSVIGGYANSASGNFSVTGGYCNSASGGCSVVAGGCGNTASGLCSFVGAGGANLATGHRSAISGGRNNTASASYSTVGGGCCNTASSSYSTVSGGLSNKSCGVCSTVSGGYSNIATGSQTTIGGGFSNRAFCLRSTVSGGYKNEAVGSYSTISGGDCNRAENTATASFIGGGKQNCTACVYSAVVGGLLNVASGDYSAVVAGSGNIATGDYSFIAGGRDNQSACANSTVSGGRANIANEAYASVGGGYSNNSSGNSATIAGGYDNSAAGNCSTVSGGLVNSASANYSAVGGGRYNQASAANATVGGGRNNVANNNESTVGGGYANNASASSSVVSGGKCNIASGTCSTVSGGYNNDACGVNTVVAGGINGLAFGTSAALLGGSSNQAYASYSVVGGGIYNRACANYGFVGGGYSNRVCLNSGNFGSIISGQCNYVLADAGVAGFIGNGCCNTVASGDYASVVNGAFNVASGDYSAVVAGSGNIASDTYSFVGGGSCNTSSGYVSTIGGGQSNLAASPRDTVAGGISNTACGACSFVGGGCLNCARNIYATVGGGLSNDAASNSSTVAGGNNNTASGLCSSVGGGFNNTASGSRSTIGGGCCNQVSNSESTVSGGNTNCITSPFGTVGGGANNTVTGSAYYGYHTIAGGSFNTVSAYFGSATVGGGQSNTASAGYATVSGGQSNCASGCRSTISGGCGNGASGSYATVSGGRSNSANGEYSFISSGCGNRTCGYANTHILGSNICATQADTTYTQNIIADGHLAATTKSFLINHPTRPGHKLQYGSLESPYHGVRLTGRDKITSGWCVVKLPEYIRELVHDNEDVNIQLTNYNHSKTLYVSEVNVAHNEFTVKTDSWFGNDLEFFWSFTATRKDIDPLRVEY